MFRILFLLIAIFFAYRFFWGAWMGYYGREINALTHFRNYVSFLTTEHVGLFLVKRPADLVSTVYTYCENAVSVQKGNPGTRSSYQDESRVVDFDSQLRLIFFSGCAGRGSVCSRLLLFPAYVQLPIGPSCRELGFFTKFYRTLARHHAL